MVFVPRPVMCAIGGWVFGFPSIGAALVGATLGSVVAFLLARYLFRARFQALVGQRPKLRAMLRAIDHEGWRLVALMRLHSPVPGSLFSYACGLTHIGVGPYAAAGLLGMAPQVVLYVYLGVVG